MYKKILSIFIPSFIMLYSAFSYSDDYLTFSCQVQDSETKMQLDLKDEHLKPAHPFSMSNNSFIKLANNTDDDQAGVMITCVITSKPAVRPGTGCKKLTVTPPMGLVLEAPVSIFSTKLSIKGTFNKGNTINLHC